MNKAYFRKIIKDRRELSDELILEKDIKNNKIIIDKYLEMDCYKKSDIIFAYQAAGRELSVQKIIDKALEEGKKIALPKIKTAVKAGAAMDFVFIDNNTGYKLGTYGILEPENDDFINVNGFDKIIELIIPGLCFDIKGNRIGYGGGYFDRYIKRFSKGRFHITALAYDYQLFESLPANEQDVQADLIITENRCIILN